jgi:hypothetical protein
VEKYAAKKPHEIMFYGYLFLSASSGIFDLENKER